MRPRFSLRTLLIVTALLAVLCYYWVIMPTQTAQRLIHAINSQDYATADKIIGHAHNFAPTSWDLERWGLITESEVEPWSLSQLLLGVRNVNMRMKYSPTDEIFNLHFHISTTSLGVRDFQTIRVLPKAYTVPVQHVTISR